MSEVRSPSSFQGWEAIAIIKDPSQRGVVLSDEYSNNLRTNVLTIDWNGEPPECVLFDPDGMMKMEDGYLLIRAAGRDLGFIPAPIVHQCNHTCNVRLND